MSRSGYNDDCDGWDLIRWRGAVRSAIKGKRGQAFLREMIAALDAMPVKSLVASALVAETGEVCAMGAVCKARSLDVSDVDPYDHDTVSARLGIADAMAREIAEENDRHPHEWVKDEEGAWIKKPLSGEERWKRMREWAQSELMRAPSAGPAPETYTAPKPGTDNTE